PLGLLLLRTAVLPLLKLKLQDSPNEAAERQKCRDDGGNAAPHRGQPIPAPAQVREFEPQLLVLESRVLQLCRSQREFRAVAWRISSDHTLLSKGWRSKKQ